MTWEEMVDVSDFQRDSRAVEGFVEEDADGEDVFVLAEPREYNAWIETDCPVDLKSWQ